MHPVFLPSPICSCTCLQLMKVIQSFQLVQPPPSHSTRPDGILPRDSAPAHIGFCRDAGTRATSALAAFWQPLGQELGTPCGNQNIRSDEQTRKL
mmetsp:Transcript_88770/g.236276  ORF Transcript_88770/g.236276 Transcript_88770/m.236276 type:complete len:95 (-) Transcript_88770:171-455(-)